MKMVCVLLATSLLQSPEPDPTLLALTPVFDGRIGNEEWLTFSDVGGFKGYLQWEPDTLYFAGVLSQGQDLVLSYDPAADGWLNGKDNREVRVSWINGTATVKVRSLDTMGRGGPVWRETENTSVTVVGSQDGEGWSVEGAISLRKTAREDRTIGAMLIGLNTGADTGAPYFPRPLTYFRLGFDGAVGLPDGVTWKSNTKLREVARQDGIELEFVVRGEAQFSTAVVRGEGLAREDLAVVSRSVSGGASSKISYKSEISQGATPGWRIVQASIGGVVLRTSIRIAELIEIDVDLPESVAYSDKDRSIKGHANIRSTGVGRIEGHYDVAVDPGWTVRKGGSQRVLIYNPRGRERVNLEFLVPAGSRGEFPVMLSVSVGSHVFTRTVMIEITPP